MANVLTNVNGLVEEVADLLRHDNLDTRINTWITSTYNEMITRAPMDVFLKNITLTYVANSESIAITTLADVGTPVYLICKETNGHTVYIPRYVTMQDFGRYSHATGGNAQATSTVPLVWSIGPDDAGLQGKYAVHIYPKCSVGLVLNLFYTANRETAPVAGDGYLDLPYHFEHILIWGAVAKGLKALRPGLYPAAKAEYEEGLQDMLMILNYHPDEVPILRQLNGPYAGSIRGFVPPRYPGARSWSQNPGGTGWS